MVIWLCMKTQAKVTDINWSKTHQYFMQNQRRIKIWTLKNKPVFCCYSSIHECWEILTEQSDQTIELRVEEFSVEEGDTCMFDYVVIYDGLYGNFKCIHWNFNPPTPPPTNEKSFSLFVKL